MKMSRRTRHIILQFALFAAQGFAADPEILPAKVARSLSILVSAAQLAGFMVAVRPTAQKPLLKGPPQ